MRNLWRRCEIISVSLPTRDVSGVSSYMTARYEKRFVCTVVDDRSFSVEISRDPDRQKRHEKSLHKKRWALRDGAIR